MRENKTFDEIQVGDTASIKRVCSSNDLYIFAHASGNLNPLHIPDRSEVGGGHETLAPSMWVGALVSAVLGNVLPGPGTLYQSQRFDFLARVHVGDELTVTITVREKLDGNRLRMDTKVTGRGGDTVAQGEAIIYAPTKKIVYEAGSVPDLEIRRHVHFDRLLDACSDRAPITVAVVSPEDKSSLGGALLAAQRALIDPILIGTESEIRRAARDAGLDLAGIRIEDVPSHEAAAERAAALAAKGEVNAIMKGALHTDTLLHAVLSKQHGLKLRRRLSHVFVFDVPGLDHPLLISDAAINIAPTLEDKVDIVQNAIDLARSIGVEEPKVGILSAVETVNPHIQSTMDAAILSKMAERGQITGGIVDGPLAMDNAMDIDAARTKGITSLVAGHADVLVVPNMEAGNMLAKELVFIAHAHGAGIVMGARVPIILTSRADDERSRLVSCALAVLGWGGAGKRRAA
ncbi:MAG: bifunctional enoyl-CoA hydratase/phosphate acetyltransferase [Alphaproteobacteria bacterium]|nr:bifunctional enoyl-CoA hydratase/phosphate acetyltransferase [Alphaproteobacteria bacterium]